MGSPLPQSCTQFCKVRLMTPYLPYQELYDLKHHQRLEPCITYCAQERLAKCMNACANGESPCAEIAPRKIMFESYCRRTIQL